jgi:hypothetical protein
LAEYLSHDSINVCSDVLGVGSDIAKASCHSDGHISYDAWIKFSTDIGLTNFEAKKLYHMLRNKDTDDIAAWELSRVVRATVASDTSMMQFAAKTLEKYGSLRNAFKTGCTDSKNVLRFDSFCGLTASLQVTNRNARKLWFVLVQGMLELPDGDASIDNTKIQEEQFVEQLVSWCPDLLPWAPNVTLQSLEQHVNMHFHGLSECRRALRQHGVPSGYEVSPQQFHDGLMAIGIDGCDADVLLSKARQEQHLKAGQRATFDDVLEAVSACSHYLPVSAGERIEKNGIQTWHHLSEEASLMQRCTSNASLRRCLGSSVKIKASRQISSPEQMGQCRISEATHSAAAVDGYARITGASLPPNVKCPTVASSISVRVRSPSRPRSRGCRDNTLGSLPKLCDVGVTAPAATALTF